MIWPKSKAIANNKTNMTENLKLVLEIVGNVGKGEKCW